MMKKYCSSISLLFLGLTLCGLTACAQPTAPVYPGDTWATADPDAYGITETEATDLYRYVRDSTRATGMLVVIGGRAILDYGDLEELSYLASCRKSILAMLYGTYVEEGTIDLNNTLEDLGMDDQQGLLDIEKQATVDHLITARSGIYHPASNSGDNSADAPARGSQSPGSYFLYNNWDFNAAGFIFEQETGIDIYDALQKDLAEPLGMQDFDREAQRKYGNRQRSLYEAYHMWLSTRDMARIGYLMLRKGKWHTRQILPEAWVDQITAVVTPAEAMNPAYLTGGEFGYGYMWWVWDDETLPDAFQGGYTARGAYGQYITVLPALDMVIALKTKATYGRSTNWPMYKGILNRLVAAVDRE